jgi:hypothetical protein
MSDFAFLGSSFAIGFGFFGAVRLMFRALSG